MTKNSNLQCPNCNSNNSALHLKISAIDAASHFIAPDEDPERHAELARHIEELWGDSECVMLDCRDCEFGYCWPFLAGDAKFYNLAYPRSNYPVMKWEFLRTLKALESLGQIDEQSKVLEIGAGDGFFLDLACPKFISSSQVVATEYYDQALNILQSKGYMALHGDNVSSVADKGPYDMMFMFQVLEHKDNIQEFFGWVKTNLKPGGSIFVAVPNKIRTTFNELNGSILDMPPNHVGRYTRKAFEKLGSISGMELVDYEVEEFRFLSYLSQDLHYSHKRRSQRTGSLAGKVRSIRNAQIRRLGIAAEATLFAPLRLPVWIKAVTNDSLGGSLWVHLRKA